MEKHFYYHQYDDYCEAQHERNRKSGHAKRNRSPDDLRLSKKTCPEESLIQIGSVEHHVEPEVLLVIAKEYFSQYEARFGEHIHILDWGSIAMRAHRIFMSVTSLIARMNTARLLRSRRNRSTAAGRIWKSRTIS